MGLFDPVDWNGDGKYDIFDDMIEFGLFQEMMNEKKKKENDKIGFDDYFAFIGDDGDDDDDFSDDDDDDDFSDDDDEFDDDDDFGLGDDF